MLFCYLYFCFDYMYIIGLEKNPKIETENELILIELDRAVKEGKAQISGPLGFKNE